MKILPSVFFGSVCILQLMLSPAKAADDDISLDKIISNVSRKQSEIRSGKVAFTTYKGELSQSDAQTLIKLASEEDPFDSAREITLSAQIQKIVDRKDRGILKKQSKLIYSHSNFNLEESVPINAITSIP